MNAASWLVSLRLAYRESWRTKGRSLLVIALVGLPVLALSGADVIWRTYQLDTGEQLSRSIGSADAAMRYVGGPLHQGPRGSGETYNEQSVNQSGTDIADHGPIEQARRLLPSSARVITANEGGVGIRTSSGVRSAAAIALDYDDPIARGLVLPIVGHAPHAPGDISLTKHLADSLRARVGDILTLTGSTVGEKLQRRVVGIVADPSSGTTDTVYVPADTPATSAFGPAILIASGRYLVGGAAIDWPTVLKLNALGYLVDSRFVRLHPPTADQVPHDVRAAEQHVDRSRVIAITLIAGMALLEIVLLAGPAFAVGARRDKRQLGLLAAVGASRRDLRRIMFSRALLLGAAAGILAVLAGTALALVELHTLAYRSDAVPGRLKIHLVELALLVLLSIVTCLAAAFLPAYRAAKADVVAALNDRRDPARRRKRVPIIGAVTAGAGVAITMVAANTLLRQNLVLTGILITEAGLITCTPALIGLLSRTANLLPLTARIALRDAGRNRTSAAPAVAAVMACVVAAIALSIGVASKNENNRRSYAPMGRTGDASVYVTNVAGTDGTSDLATKATKIVSILKSTLPAQRIDTISQVQAAPPCVLIGPAGGAIGPAAGATGCAQTTPTIAIASPLCTTGSTSGSCASARMGTSLIVDDGRGASALFGDGTSAARAAAALRDGKVVVSSPDEMADGFTAVGIGGFDANGTTPMPDERAWHKVPAVFLPAAYSYVPGPIVPPAVAEQLGLTPMPFLVVSHNSAMPSDKQQQRANAQLAAIDESATLYVERGYQDKSRFFLLGLVISGVLLSIGAAGIATALANVDGAPDLQTLAHIGADRGVRRRISMSRAATITLLGLMLGIPAGFVPAWAWVSFVRANDAHSAAAWISSSGGFQAYSPLNVIPQMPFVVPWVTVAIIVVAVPACAIVAAGLFTRSRVPVTRLR